MSAPVPVPNKDSAALTKALARLEALHPKKIDLGLPRIERVLKKLGAPQNALPPTVHVAGTNGKGSTIAFLRAMAQAQGLKVHVYTSPHLVSFRERIVLASEMVSEDDLQSALSRVEAANGGKPLSFFEATTAAAFLLFHEHAADLLILETGLGGLYDATNVIAAPAAVAITPIDYDHAEFLGRDLAGIAREKAGIFKANTPAFSARQSRLVTSVLSAEAAKLRAPLKFKGEHFQCHAEQGRLIYEDDDALLDLPLPALRGAHQIENAGLAIAVARSLLIDERAISQGLSTASWPARLQPLTAGELANIAQSEDAELWLDGGHNPHAGKALAEALAGLEARAPRPLVLIMGILANKDAPGFLDAFAGLAQTLIAVPIEGHASLAPESLMDIAKGRGITALRADNLMKAVTKAAGLDPHTPPRILICGSLYLAGEALAL